MTQHILIEHKTNTAATVAITLSIIGFIFSLIPFFGWLLLPVWILAILFGIVASFNPYKRGTAITATVIGVLTIIYKFAIIEALFG
jgi:uncharacterized membrane protein HdeD (DUF308 family)